MAMRKPHYLRFIEPPEGPKDDKGTGDGTGGPTAADMPNGFPTQTPVADMTIEQQAAYWKYHSRQHEGVAKSRADYDQQKADAEKWRQYQNDNKPADQKAIDEAAEQARIDERRKAAPRLVKAEFKAAAVNKVPQELLDAFLEDVDPLVYLDKNGDVDEAKVEKRVKALTPKSSQQERLPNHQGFRRTDGVTSVSAGRSLFADRHKK